MTPSGRKVDPTWQDGPGPDPLCPCGSSRISRHDGHPCADCQEEALDADTHGDRSPEPASSLPDAKGHPKP